MVDLDLRSRRDGPYSSLSQQRSKVLQRYYSRAIQWRSPIAGRNGSTMVQHWQWYQNLRLFVNWSWKRTHRHYPAKVRFASLTRHPTKTHVVTAHRLGLDAVWLYDQSWRRPSDGKPSEVQVQTARRQSKWITRIGIPSILKHWAPFWIDENLTTLYLFQRIIWADNIVSCIDGTKTVG